MAICAAGSAKWVCLLTVLALLAPLSASAKAGDAGYAILLEGTWCF